MPLPAVLIALAVMAVVLVGQGMLLSLGNAFSSHPLQSALGVAAAAVCVGSAIWVSRSRRREPVFFGVLGAILVGGWFATYDTNGGRGMFGLNIAPHVYKATGFAYGSFADRLETGAKQEIAYAERCDAAINGNGDGDPAICRDLFVNGVDQRGLARLRAAVDARDWEGVENARRSLGDKSGLRSDLW